MRSTLNSLLVAMVAVSNAALIFAEFCLVFGYRTYLSRSSPGIVALTKRKVLLMANSCSPDEVIRSSHFAIPFAMHCKPFTLASSRVLL